MDRAREKCSDGTMMAESSDLFEGWQERCSMSVESLQSSKNWRTGADAPLGNLPGSNGAKSYC